MPATATVDADHLLSRLKAEAITTWRSWAEAIADGGDPPSLMEVLATGAILRVRDPMVALVHDGEALRDARELEARAARHRETLNAAIGNYGGAEGVRQRVRAIEEELRQLRKLIGPYAFSQVGTLLGEATNLRRLHPRAFAPDTGTATNTRKPAPAKPTRRRAAS